MLFSNKGVADFINENFVAGWENVRAVPKVTIDFGDGRTLKRTLNGNIATYLCTPDGRVFDIIPGLYNAATYRARLAEGLQFYRAARKKGNLKGAVVALHRDRAPAPRFVQDRDVRAAVSKSRVESPVKSALKKDTLNNESVRMAGVRDLLIKSPLATPADLTKHVYKEILDTDLDDPYLGLAPMVLGGEIGREMTR